MADSNGQLSQSSLSAGVEDASHGLEVAAAIAADQDTGVLQVASGRAEGGSEFFCRDDAAVERDRAVSKDVEQQAFVGGRQMASLSYTGYAKLDLPLQFDELGARHEEDDEQEQHVDHRREVENRNLIPMRLERHGEQCSRCGLRRCRLGGLLAYDLDVSAGRAGLQRFCGDQLDKLAAALIEFHGELVHAAYEE